MAVFLSPHIGCWRVRRYSLGMLFGLLICFSNGVANGQSVSVFFSGTLAAGQTDTFGLFGPVGGDLSGLTFTGSTSYDPADFSCDDPAVCFAYTNGAMTSSVTINGQTQTVVTSSEAYAVAEFMTSPSETDLSNVGAKPLVPALEVTYYPDNLPSLDSPQNPPNGGPITFTFRNSDHINEQEVLQGVSTVALSITTPTPNGVYNLADDDYIETTIPFMASEADSINTVNWTVNFSYTTSGGVGPFIASEVPFEGTANSPKGVSYYSVGGQVVAHARDSSGAVASPVTFYVAGNPYGIPNYEITELSRTSYSNNHSGISPYTPTLLCHIAWQESNYRQFKYENLFSGNGLVGIAAKWPIENVENKTNNIPRGKYIGLLMPETNLLTAFDWKWNISVGLAQLNLKLRASLSYQSMQRNALPNLPTLDGIQVENMALVLYGGFGNRDPKTCQLLDDAAPLRYYVPSEDRSKWIINPAINCTSGQGNSAYDYVKGIRGNTIPQ